MTSTVTDYRELTGTYTFDPAHSRLGFVARHAMVTKVRGAFNEFEGTASIDGDDPARSTVTLAIDVAGIDTRNGQRDDHLRTNDFLDVANHPKITFTSTAIRHLGGGDFEVEGDLTIKGVTRRLTVPLEFQGAAKDPFGNHRIGFEGSTTINRKDFGVTWNVALETGGVLVGEKVVLEFEISAIRNA